MTELLEKQEATLAKLRQLLCPASTEKTKAVLEQAGLEPGEKNHKRLTPHSQKKAARGHGRHAAAAYSGAAKVRPVRTRDKGFRAALDCDVSFACVDRPWWRYP